MSENKKESNFEKSLKENEAFEKFSAQLNTKPIELKKPQTDNNSIIKEGE